MPLFEIHISVDPDQFIELQAYCAVNGMKVLLVKNTRGLHQWQLLVTVWVMRETGEQAIQRAQELAAELEAVNLRVMRTKVEFELNESKISEELMSRCCYYEFHIKIPTNDLIKFEAIKKASELHQIKWSVLVQSKETQFMPIATIRTKCLDVQEAVATKNRFMDMLKAMNVRVHSKMHQEMCIYDNFEGLDEGWF